MSTLRKRRPRDHQEPNKNAKPNEEINNNEHHETPKISVYEQTREERIKENLERMQKLGLMDLSLKLKACTAPPKRTPRTSPSSTKHPTPFLPRGPLRRSSRCACSMTPPPPLFFSSSPHFVVNACFKFWDLYYALNVMALKEYFINWV
jgi:hypothetical protein